MSEQRLRHTELEIGVLEVRNLGRLFRWKRLAGLTHGAEHLVAVHRRLENAGSASQLGCTHTDPVHLDVVGVAVAAVGVVHRQHIGRHLAKDRCVPSGRGLNVGAPEAVGPVIAARVHHPRVDVAEELDAIDAKDLRRFERLTDPAQAERLSRIEKPVRHFAELAAGRDDQHRAVSVGCHFRHRSTRLDALVVRMSVEEDERRHQATAPVDRSSAIESLSSPSQSSRISSVC